MARWGSRQEQGLERATQGVTTRAVKSDGFESRPLRQHRRWKARNFVQLEASAPTVRQRWDVIEVTSMRRSREWIQFGCGVPT